MAFGKKRQNEEMEADQGYQQQATYDASVDTADGDQTFESLSRYSDSCSQKKAEVLATYSRDSSNYTHKRAKKAGRGKRVAAGIVAALFVVVLGFGTAVAIFINGVSADLSGNKTEEEKFEIQEALVTSSYSEPFYVLLIGSDSRDYTDFTGSRSDTNILCRVDPVNKVVTMLSIPRDTKINIPGYGTQKFNAAYAYGGVAGVINATSELCGVDISHYIQIGFDGVKDLVDSLGGVEVDVPYEIHDYDAWGDIEPGLQTLSGWDALVFARSRQYADGDFTRTSNQRILVEAIAKQVLAMPVAKLPGVVQTAAKCVDTDMSVFDIYSLAMAFKDDLTIYSAMVPSTTAFIDEVSYVICDTETLGKMMQIIEQGGDPNTVENNNGSAIGSSLE